MKDVTMLNFFNLWNIITKLLRDSVGKGRFVQSSNFCFYVYIGVLLGTTAHFIISERVAIRPALVRVRCETPHPPRIIIWITTIIVITQAGSRHIYGS
jgi:hypothetical protein